jgi:hypothetical protein
VGGMNSIIKSWDDMADDRETERIASVQIGASIIFKSSTSRVTGAEIKTPNLHVKAGTSIKLTQDGIWITTAKDGNELFIDIDRIDEIIIPTR